MDEILRDRLSLPPDAHVKLRAIRMALHVLDWSTRSLTGQPFFALRETEALLTELEGLEGDAFIRALMARRGGTTITAHGLEHVPPRGAVIIAATHPIGTFDFLAHALALQDRRPDLKVVANREVERFLGAGKIVAVDLDKHHRTRSARSTRDGMQEHLESGGAILIFGSGRVPYLGRGGLVEPQWRSGTTRVSDAVQAPIVPAAADMRNSRHYYTTRRLVYRLSRGNDDLATKVASLRYVSELLAKLGGRYDVHYGAPQPPGTAPDRLKALAEGLVPGLYATR